METGFIKLHRKITEWEWYTDNNCKIVFFHLLLTANHKPNKWRGISIERGQVLTGIHSLSEQLGLTVQSIRTVFLKLKSTGEITIKSTSKYSIITICKYDTYQDNQQAKQQTEQQAEQQTSNKPTTTNKNDKNNKEDKEDKNIIPFDQFWEVYENKKGKVQAEKLWAKMTNEEREKAIKAIPLYEESKKDSPIKFWKHGSTYLSQRVWEDFEAQPPKLEVKVIREQDYYNVQDYLKDLKKYGHDIPEHLRQYA